MVLASPWVPAARRNPKHRDVDAGSWKAGRWQLEGRALADGEGSEGIHCTWHGVGLVYPDCILCLEVHKGKQSSCRLSTACKTLG